MDYLVIGQELKGNAAINSSKVLEATEEPIKGDDHQTMTFQMTYISG